MTDRFLHSDGQLPVRETAGRPLGSSLPQRLVVRYDGDAATAGEYWNFVCYNSNIYTDIEM